MVKFHLAQYDGVRKTLVIVGIFLLAISGVLFFAGVFGVISMTSLGFGGQSGLRTIAGVAVLGCLLAAIGSWDQ